MSESKNFFTDKQIKSSRRYLLGENKIDDEQNFDNIQELSGHENVQDNMKHSHIQEIEQDIMPKAGVNETEQSEFRKLPQLDMVESDEFYDQV